MLPLVSLRLGLGQGRGARPSGFDGKQDIPFPFIFVDFLGSLKEQFKYYPVYCYPFADGLYVVAAAEKYKPMVGRKFVYIGSLSCFY